MKKLDKNLLLQNIKYLANKDGDKTGEVEKAAGVSQGYLSRIAKMDENPNMPLMDLLLWAADKYKVSVDSLLNVDLQSMTPNEHYLRRLFEKLASDTIAGVLSWTSETKNMLENYHGQFGHPLMEYEGTSNGEDFFYYKSLYDPDNQLGDLSIFCWLKDQLLYITQVCHRLTIQKGFEVYFSNIQKDNALELVHVIPGNTLYPLVDTVFNEGVKSSHQIKVSQKARSIIDTYLNPPIEDDLPF